MFGNGVAIGIKRVSLAESTRRCVLQSGTLRLAIGISSNGTVVAESPLVSTNRGPPERNYAASD